MKTTFKILYTQAISISIMLLLIRGIISLIAYLNGDATIFPWYFPLETVLVGVVTALPSLLFYSHNELSKKAYICRIFVHFTLVLSIVTGLGCLFKWFVSVKEYLMVFAIFIIIYIGIWGLSYLFFLREEKSINKSLKDFNSK